MNEATWKITTFACLGIDALINASTNFMHNLLPKWSSLRILANVYIYTISYEFMQGKSGTNVSGYERNF